MKVFWLEWTNFMINTICIENILFFKSNATNANSFISIISTCLVLNKIFTIIYLFYKRFLLINYKFVILKIMKNNSKTTFILLLVSKKIFAKNQIFSNLFKSLKFAITIL